MNVELPLNDGVWTIDGENLLRDGVIVEHVYNLNQDDNDRLWKIFTTITQEECALAGHYPGDD